MDFLFWIAAAWFGLSVAGAFAVAAFIRENRGADEPVPVRVAFSRPDRAAPHR